MALSEIVDSIQDSKDPVDFPHGNIFITDTCLKSITEVETAVTALYAFEVFRGHGGPLFCGLWKFTPRVSLFFDSVFYLIDGIFLLYNYYRVRDM